MRSLSALVIIGSLQVIFLLLVIVLVLSHRRRATVADRERRRHARQLDAPLRSWALRETTLTSLLPSLRAMPSSLAIEFTAGHAELREAAGADVSVSSELRAERWMQQAIDGHRSRRWTIRLQAARAIAVCGDVRDRPVLASLLEDSHAAVTAVALSAFGRLADGGMVAHLLERLPALPEYLQRRATDALRATGDAALPPLRDRVRSEQDPSRLRIYLSLANALADPRTIILCAEHARHTDARIRTEVARLCQHYFSARVHRVLLDLLRDPVHGVRAEAARSIGELRASALIPALAGALRDPSHGVRLAAALALAGMGSPGRSALLHAELSDDRFASDTARLVVKLSPGAIRELVEA